ncbi:MULTISPECIES: hypothetical protein [unclassified Micromonospora]|uniref:hypothetical protein n=1 Tax=unclassified Micromonospora TaxID=2617518 RepID=UPI00098D0742|nr:MULTISPECIES: hypothetical protein [unclassified Micromonospora]OON27144.1 hypothetical protein BSA16_33610 [Micromonospora sp. Rc5]
MTVKWTALKLIAERAKETGARGVDVRELEALSAVVEDLVRDGVLTQDRREIRFSHEALFDQVIARSWAESDLPLVSVLLATDQDLSHRSLVRQVLTYQRGTDHAAYERSISGILGSPDIRYHLKDVALSVLASDQAPSQALWELVSADPVVEVLTTPAWFAYAETAGAVLRWAVGDQPDLAATMLDAALEWDSDRVAEILTALLPIHAWRDKLRLLIDRGPTGSSPTFCRLVAAALTRGLFDNDGVMVDGLFLYSLTEGEGNAEGRLEVLDAFVARWLLLSRERGSTLEAVTGRHHAIVGFLRAMASREPTAFVSVVLPHVTAYLASAETSWRPLVANKVEDPAHTLLGALTDALTTLDFLPYEADLLSLPDSAIARFLLYRAWAGNADRYAGGALEFLVADPTRYRCGYLDSPYWVTRDLIAAIHPHLTPAQRLALEQSILGFYPDWERTARGRAAQGSAQFVLLDGLNATLMAPDTLRRRSELQRKFGGRPSPPQGVEFGFVPSPIEPASAARMTDDQWLGAMRRYHSDDREGWLKGGPHELSTVLQEEARKDPGRFLNLVREMPGDVHEAYPSAILIGAGDSVSATEAEALYSALRRLHELPGRPGGRWIGKPLARLADMEIPDDVLEMVCWYATEDPDPEEDSWLSRDKQGAPYDGDPLTAGINSVRGAAAETISALLWPRPERLPFFADTLRRICSDRLGAVRACAAVAVLTVAKHDESFARELLGVLVRDAHYRVLATPYVERCIARFKARPGPRLWFLVRRMSQSRVPGTREAGGRLAAQMALESGSAALLNGTVGRWPESRKGVAQVAAALLESDDLRVRGRCAEWLGQLFHDEDPTVRHAAAEWVHSFTEADPASRTLLAAFLASPAYLDDPWPLLKALDDSDHIGSAVVIDAIRLLMTDEPRPGPRRVTRHAHQGLVSDMAIRAYASADTPSIRTAALDLIDDLLSQRDPHIRRLLTRHEAAPGLS